MGTKIEFENTIEDLLDWNVHIARVSPVAKSTRIRASLFIGAFVFLIVEVIAAAELNLLMAAAGVVLAAVATAAIYGSYPKATRKLAKRVYGQGKNEGMVGLHTLEIDGELLRETSPKGLQETAIKSLERIDETPGAVYIHLSTVAAHVIPRGGVTSGDLEGFLGELRTTIEG